MNRVRKHHRAATRYWIGYCRKSTDSEDKQVHTLQDQAAMIREYYARLPDEERRRCPLRLLQEAQSAYRPGRPVFRAVLQMADRGEVRGIIAVHPNRISRNHADSGAFVQRLVEGAIPALDTTAGKRYTGADSNDIFMLTLEGAMSWKDSRDKGDRIRQAMRMRAAEGRHMGPLRVGYKSVFRPDGTSVVETVPEAAPSVRRLFELAGAGTHSVKDLTAEADRLGLKSRTGRRLHASTIHAMLRDPLYKGDVRFDGIVAKGRHEPIVDAPLWGRVQHVLTSRRTGTARPKDPGLRDLFVFGDLLKCPRCDRTLRPYRVKGRYIYYECKNPGTACRVLAPQVTLVDQLPPLLATIRLGGADLEALRGRLLRTHRERTQDAGDHRRALTAQYDKVVREIGDVFSQRKEAEALGVLDVVDLRLTELRDKRDDLQGQLDARRDRGDAWVESVVQSFRLVELLQEAIFFGSRHPREIVLRGLASNYTVDGRKLVPKLRSPFRECARKGGHPEWYTELYGVRTEIEETADLLRSAYETFEGARLLRIA